MSSYKQPIKSLLRHVFYHSYVRALDGCLGLSITIMMTITQKTIATHLLQIFGNGAGEGVKQRGEKQGRKAKTEHLLRCRSSEYSH